LEKTIKMVTNYSRQFGSKNTGATMSLLITCVVVTQAVLELGERGGARPSAVERNPREGVVGKVSRQRISEILTSASEVFSGAGTPRR